MVQRVARFFPTLATWLFFPALAVIVWGELTPGVGLNIWDKLQHFLAYFGLAGLSTVALGTGRRAIWAALALVALGGALEILQGFTGRDPDIHDEIANTVGVAFGWLAGLGTNAVLRLLVAGRAPD
ncbi:MAG TPA: VanZ family protein [Rhizomicrobium sp.]|nr:VanZ family protein [Rhizomicrobium sp.]